MLRCLCQSLKFGGKFAWSMKSECFGNILHLDYLKSFSHGLSVFGISFPPTLNSTVKLFSLKCFWIYFLVEVSRTLQWLCNNIESPWPLETSSNLTFPLRLPPSTPAMCPRQGSFLSFLPCLFLPPCSLSSLPPWSPPMLSVKLNLSWLCIPLLKYFYILRALITVCIIMWYLWKHTSGHVSFF